MARDMRKERNAYRNTYESTYESDIYVYGNTARRLDVQREYEEQLPQRRQLGNEARKNRERAKNLSLGYILFVVAAVVMSVVILMGYIGLMSEINSLRKETAQQEKTLNTMRVDNDEALTRIDASLDLEHIKYVAITQLGMVYPKEGQVITYEGVDYDYVRKVGAGD